MRKARYNVMEWLPSIASGATLTPLGGSGVSPLQAVEKLALSLINQWFSSHPSARIQ
jgi:hypothetical protein